MSEEREYIGGNAGAEGADGGVKRAAATGQREPSSPYIQLDDRSGAASGDGGPRVPRRRTAIAAALAVACLVLIVACLGFVRPAPDGSWSVAWLFQTTAETDVTAGSADAAEPADDDAANDASSDAAADPDAPVSSDADASAPAADGAATDGVEPSSGAEPSSGQGAGNSASAPSAGDGAPSNPGAGTATEPAPAPQGITVSVSVDSSAAGGQVSASSTVSLDAGATAYDALCALGLSVNAQSSAFGTYVAAIGGLAEFDYGGSSGWVYAVNGVEPGTSASGYALADGDVVTWTYVTS